jgi:hypothetical protein
MPTFLAHNLKVVFINPVMSDEGKAAFVVVTQPQRW